MSYSFFFKKINYLTTTLFISFISFPSIIIAAENNGELDEVIVTATPFQTNASSIPHNVSIITANDIDKSNAVSLADLLSREANLNLKSFSGTDKNTSIDMRGMGDTAVSNVLILVDGVRLNESDLSGADLSTIAVAQIDRIEIIRGGGSVMFGDGAVGGVINILTKKSKAGTNKLSVEAAQGSYGLKDLRTSTQVSDDVIAVSLNASHLKTDGFRKNGGLESKNASFEFRMLPVEELSFLTAFIRVANHEDEYGLPGPVGAQAFKNGTAARRASSSPFDYGTTQDDIYTTGVAADFEKAGRLDLQFTLRNRDNDYVIGYNPVATIKAQQASIASQRENMSLKYSLDFEAFNLPASYIMGLNTLSADYRTYNAGKYQPSTLKKEGDINSRGIFASATVKPTTNLDITAGIRTERVRGDFNENRLSRTCTTIAIPVFPFQIQGPCTPYSYMPTGESFKGSRTMQGIELGSVWQISPTVKGFASWTKHFRTPNVDEFALASDTLRPQTGKTWESGLRYKPSTNFETSLTVFNIRIDDEIYYGADPAAGVSLNRNYDKKTNRSGAELEVRYRFANSLAIKANAGYVAPEFVGTQSDIPNVPRTTINAQLEYNPIQDLSWILNGRYVGSRFDGNDFNNDLYPKLPAYTVFDTSVRYSLGKTDLIVGINNIFDKAYSTLGYSATYYPMPERNTFVRVKFNL